MVNVFWLYVKAGCGQEGAQLVYVERAWGQIEVEGGVEEVCGRQTYGKSTEKGPTGPVRHVCSLPYKVKVDEGGCPAWWSAEPGLFP